MNSIFLRIYGGMLAALVLVALLGVGALHLVNEVRADQYRDQCYHGGILAFPEPFRDTQRSDLSRSAHGAIDAIGVRVRALFQRL